MTKNEENSKLTTKTDQDTPKDKSLVLGGEKGAEIDLSGLTDAQIQALKMENAKRSIEITEKGQNLALSAQALDVKLQSMTDKGSQASEAGLSVNITNVKDDEMGRTEIIIGNTEASAKGQLSRSQKGLNDNTGMWLAFILLALAIIGGTLAYLFGTPIDA